MIAGVFYMLSKWYIVSEVPVMVTESGVVPPDKYYTMIVTTPPTAVTVIAEVREVVTDVFT